MRRPRGSRTASGPLRREVREAGEHEIRPRTTTVTGHGYHLTSIEQLARAARRHPRVPYQRPPVSDKRGAGFCWGWARVCWGWAWVCWGFAGGGLGIAMGMARLGPNATTNEPRGHLAPAGGPFLLFSWRKLTPRCWGRGFAGDRSGFCWGRLWDSWERVNDPQWFGTRPKLQHQRTAGSLTASWRAVFAVFVAETDPAVFGEGLVGGRGCWGRELVGEAGIPPAHTHTHTHTRPARPTRPCGARARRAAGAHSRRARRRGP